MMVEAALSIQRDPILNVASRRLPDQMTGVVIIQGRALYTDRPLRELLRGLSGRPAERAAILSNDDGAALQTARSHEDVFSPGNGTSARAQSDVPVILLEPKDSSPAAAGGFEASVRHYWIYSDNGFLTTWFHHDVFVEERVPDPGGGLNSGAWENDRRRLADETAKSETARGFSIGYLQGLALRLEAQAGVRSFPSVVGVSVNDFFDGIWRRF